MKTHRLAIRTLSAITLAAIAALAVTACSQQQEPLEHFQDLPGLLSAMQAFSRELTNKGQPLPQSISLGELISRGYIASNSVRAFEGKATMVWLTVNPAVVNSVLISARLPDGSISAALADGSVQQFSAQSFADHLKKTGQGGAPTASQPLSSVTNSTPGAATSSR